MVDIPPSSDHHERFIDWAKKQGVSIDGVWPAGIAGRGIGIIAQRKIKAGELLVTVPTSALFTIKSIPPDFRDKHAPISVHGMLASFLTLGKAEDTGKYTEWCNTWPSLADFKQSMPILWPKNLPPLQKQPKSSLPVFRSFIPLPPAVSGEWKFSNCGRSKSRYGNSKGLLQKQQERLTRDWNVVSRVYPNARYEKYTYNWLIVNTRSFYYDLLELKRVVPREDCMVLCPLVDYFNHADHGCEVTFNENGFTVTSDRDYAVGEELYVSYGSHNNDFLLTEYGFILSQNKWDSLCVDDVLLSKLHHSTLKRLENAGYLGNYTLSCEGLCHRTQVAVRTMTIGKRDWQLFVEGREEEMEAERDEFKADSWVCYKLLDECKVEAEYSLEMLEDERMKDPDFTEAMQATLIKRWTQIKRLIFEAFRNGINDDTKHAFFSENMWFDVQGLRPLEQLIHQPSSLD
ncbi:MAG: hypothetical protein Q9187_003030 [Circinaria calcarea]